MTALGPYDLEAAIGRGGQGAVYRARHRPTGATRAVKVLEGVSDVEALDRFRREAESLARVAGDGVVRIHEAGSVSGRLWYAMDLLEGGSLAERLRRAGRLDWREAALLAARLSRTLERCATAGIVHRDLKPANVLLGEDGRPRLVDFGLARDLAAASLTATGAALGTLEYMAPEQLRGERAGPAADVFALGVVLHELATGSRPFAGRSPHELHERIREAAFAPASGVAGSPPSLDAAIARALACDPARRPGAGELASSLEALVAAKPAPAKEPSPATPARALAAGLALAGLALVVLLVVKGGHAPPREALAASPPPRTAGPTPAGPATSASPVTPATSSPGLPRGHDDLERAVTELDAGSAKAVGDLDRAIRGGLSPEDQVRAVAAVDERTKRLENVAFAAPAEEIERRFREAAALDALVRIVVPDRPTTRELGLLAAHYLLARGEGYVPSLELRLEALVDAARANDERDSYADRLSGFVESKDSYALAAGLLVAATQRAQGSVSPRWAGRLAEARGNVLRTRPRGFDDEVAAMTAYREALALYAQVVDPTLDWDRYWTTHFLAFLEYRSRHADVAAQLLEPYWKDPALTETNAVLYDLHPFRLRAQICVALGRLEDARVALHAGARALSHPDQTKRRTLAERQADSERLAALAAQLDAVGDSHAALEEVKRKLDQP